MIDPADGVGSWLIVEKETRHPETGMPDYV